jgi:hypothetical protein
MTSEFPSLSDLKLAASRGQRITPDDVSVIGQLETELTGSDNSAGDGSARVGPMQKTAQGIAAGQIDFDAKLDELSQKPRSHITREDAMEIQELEVLLLPLSIARLC